MQMRPVPRNIDRPNRTPEFAMAFLTFYYGTMFLTGKALFALLMGFLATYLMYKVTQDKPEGLAMRMLYKKITFGKMVPSPVKCKVLEV